MATDTKTVVQSSFPVMGLLGVVLVTLKLLGKITLSWVWVLAPFWVPWLIAAVVIGILLLIALFVLFFGEID